MRVKIKSEIKLLLLIFFLFSSLAIKAEEFSAFKKTSNAVYQFINDHEYLLVPLADTVGGLSLCGPWCALGGGVIGAAEELLVDYGFADKRYLTYMVLGGATGNMLSPKLISTGVLFGSFFTGMFQGNEELIAPTFTATLGMQASEVSGLGWSIYGSAVDIFARQMGLTEKYPITSFVLIPKFLNSILGPGIATVVTIGLNTILYNDQNLAEIFRGPAFNQMVNIMPMGGMAKTYSRVITKLYENYDKLIPQNEFKEHLEKNFIALLGGQLLTHWIVIKQIMLNQNLEYRFEHLDQLNGNAAGNQLISHGIKFAVFIVPWVVGQLVTNSVEKYYDDKLSITLKNNIQNKLFSNENLLRLSKHGNFAMYLDNLNRDTATVTSLGSSLFSDAISTSVNGMYGASMIVIHSRNLLFYTFLYQTVLGLITPYLASQSISYDEEVKFLNSELISIYKDTKEHVRTITERDGINATWERAQELSTEIIDTEGKRNLWDLSLQLFLKANQVLGTILNYCLVGREIRDGRLPFEKRNLLRKAVMDESDLFSWGDRNLVSIGQVERSLDRLIVLEGIIDLPPSKLDQIVRIPHRGDQLILKNLEVGVGDRVLVKVDDLKLNMGKVYAITGDTGCGKTSLLSKIKGIKENGIYGKGKIFYPKINSKDSKIIMLSQQDYFPLDSTLADLLIYPDKFSADPMRSREQKKEMVALLKEIGLRQFTSATLNVESKENWYMRLSGGEKKKMLIISAIIKKPDILMLDEVFNGLDLESIKIVQKMLKKYLSNSLILVVDHHAADNNFKFYNNEVRFMDKKLVVHVVQEVAIPA